MEGGIKRQTAIAGPRDAETKTERERERETKKRGRLTRKKTKSPRRKFFHLVSERQYWLSFTVSRFYLLHLKKSNSIIKG